MFEKIRQAMNPIAGSKLLKELSLISKGGSYRISFALRQFDQKKVVFISFHGFEGVQHHRIENDELAKITEFLVQANEEI